MWSVPEMASSVWQCLRNESRSGMIQMPNMDGYKATTIIRHLEDPRLSKIPIIAMTANAFAEDKAKAAALGMNAHVAKPFDIRVLKRVMADVLGKQ